MRASEEEENERVAELARSHLLTRPTAAVPTGDGPLTAVRARRASVSPRGNCWRAQPVRIGVSAGKASDYASW